MPANTFKTLHIWDTKFSADSVEWCPISPYKNFFACGTYFLKENTDENSEDKKSESERAGSITIFAVFKEKLEAKHSINCPAILDMKWAGRKVNGNIALATANAVGELSLFYFGEGFFRFITKCVLKEGPGDFLMLSLDWVKTDSPDLICSSDSRGNVALVKVANDALQLLSKWKAHSLEAWIVSFDSFNTRNVYSGGDEGKMKIWDCRCQDAVEVAALTEHNAGVTTLNSNIYKENNLVSGSYDETALFWDTRSWKSPMGKITTSGGVWRLKWEPQNRSKYLLGACIYGGFQVYDVSSYSVVANYKEHESLAYGADWCYFINDELQKSLNCEETAMIATCSFYDHKLCVSLWNEN